MIPPGNTDYWYDDTSGEILTTGRMIYLRETLTTGRMIPPGNTDYW
jgi:hypothetical protein